MKIKEAAAPVSEIFYSYQGEGIYLGQPQIFIRFYGCNLKCNYCDTKIHKFKKLSVQEIINKVIKLAGKSRPVVSITGGEPLVYADFLKMLLPVLKKKGFKIYLETNGTLPEALKKVISLTDIVSADIKMPSACGRAFWQEHERFLKAAGKKAFVKVVVTSKTTEKEFMKALKTAEKMSKNLPFVIQPATPYGNCKSIHPKKLYNFISLAKKRLKSCLCIPQMHHFWKVR